MRSQPAAYRPFISGSCGLFLAAGLLFFTLPREIFPSYVHHPVFLGVTSLLAPILILLPFLVFRPETDRQRLAVARTSAGIAFGLLANGAGELGLFELHEYGIPYDKYAHFFVSALAGLLIGENLAAWTGLSVSRRLLFVFFGTFALGILWEGFEALSDMLFHTQIWGIYGKYITEDTRNDILGNSLGGLLAVILLHIRYGLRLGGTIKGGPS